MGTHSRCNIVLLVKLGGSIITNKQKPLTPRKDAMQAIARVLKKIDEPLMLVHGGGSFGHYWSVRYDMHTKPDAYDPGGVATVKNSMVQLNLMVLESLLECGVKPYAMNPASFVRGSRPLPSRIIEAGEITGSGLVPVTYGDAIWRGGGQSYILSGDRIMGMLARKLRPRLCIFALDADGVYSDPKTGRVIREFAGEEPAIAEIGMDVTGGIRRKIEEAEKIAQTGTDVFFVNGNKPARILGASAGRFNGTLFRGR